MDENFERLVQTLMSNRLAASATEANRMAQEMLGTSAKVNAGFQKDKFYAVKNFTREKETGTSQSSPSRAQSSTTQVSPAEQKIEEFRRSAINPQPVNVQVNFQTPQTDTTEVQTSTPEQAPESLSQPEIKEFEPLAEPVAVSAPVNDQPTAEEAIVPEAPTYQESQTIEPVAQPQEKVPMTPEEYSAAQMSNGSVSTSDFLSLKQKEPAQQESFTTDTGKPEFSSQTIPTSSPQDFPGEKPEVQNSDLFNNVPEAEPVHTEFSNPVNYGSTPQEKTRFDAPTPDPIPEPITQSTSNSENTWPDQANTGNQSNWSNNQVQEEQQPQQEENQMPKPTRRGTWSEEDKKLAEDVDITKLFNYSNK